MATLRFTLSPLLETEQEFVRYIKNREIIRAGDQMPTLAEQEVIRCTLQSELDRLWSGRTRSFENTPIPEVEIIFYKNNVDIGVIWSTPYTLQGIGEN